MSWNDKGCVHYADVFLVTLPNLVELIGADGSVTFSVIDVAVAKLRSVGVIRSVVGE